jgi:hypothetical protein
MRIIYAKNNYLMPRAKKLNMGERCKKGKTGNAGRPKGKISNLVGKSVECIEEIDSEALTYESQIDIKENLSVDDVKKLLEERLSQYESAKKASIEEARKKKLEEKAQRKLLLAETKKQNLIEREKKQQEMLELQKKQQEETNKQQYEYINRMMLNADKESIASKLRETRKHQYNNTGLML